jgi:sugar (pentulose or hexulose) kinase
MVAGFALLAFPADYGSTGIKTLIVNHYGIVYEKDLGKNSATTARAMTEYNPDSTWSEVEE